jgi:hypothetical protein
MKISGSNHERIQRAIEGLLPEEEMDALKRDILADADLRVAYVEQMWLHASLQAERESLGEIFEEAAPVESKIVRRWPAAAWAAAAAACVTLLATIFLSGKGTLFRRAVATLVQAENCKWAGSDLPTAVNSKLGAGKLVLVEGIATLKFKNGATVTMEAPTTLEIRDAMHCRLIEGTLTAEVPEPAHGFTVDTPDIKVVDLGTKFGVTTAATGNSQVRVFQGEVEIGDEAPHRGQRNACRLGKYDAGAGADARCTRAGIGRLDGDSDFIRTRQGWLCAPRRQRFALWSATRAHREAHRHRGRE